MSNPAVMAERSATIFDFNYNMSSQKLFQLKVVIGFDARHNSKRWAGLTASVFAHLGFQVYLNSGISPTPWVPYGVLDKKALVGIMVTASHNPKWDNGYKVYWDNGAQIIPPHDTSIQHCIIDHLEPEIEIESRPESELISDSLLEFSGKYFADLKSDFGDQSLSSGMKHNLVYTAMHGVGSEFIDRAAMETGFKPVIHVKEQRGNAIIVL